MARCELGMANATTTLDNETYDRCTRTWSISRLRRKTSTSASRNLVVSFSPLAVSSCATKNAASC